MPDRLEDILFDLEERFWRSGGEHFAHYLADAAVAVLPGPGGLLLDGEIARAVANQPRWTHVVLEEHRVLELSAGAAMVTYRATARRSRGKPYFARATSAYVHDGTRWRLAFHQQTPVRK